MGRTRRDSAEYNRYKARVNSMGQEWVDVYNTCLQEVAAYLDNKTPEEIQDFLTAHREIRATTIYRMPRRAKNKIKGIKRTRWR